MFKEDFISKIIKLESGCWTLKTKSKTKLYLSVQYKGKLMLAHRYSYEFFNDCKIPKGKCVLHSCDNPQCINPAHLRLGTIKENNHEIIKKRRNAKTINYTWGTVKERIQQKIIVNEITGCWEGQGPTNAGGYIGIYVKGKSKLLHRVSYEEYMGPIPDSLLVLHKCDNTRCCNPEHLWTGTNKDNMQDMSRKLKAAI